MEHKNSFSASYAAAGVDITAGYKSVELMKKHVARTRNEGSVDDVGGFGGCFNLSCVAGMEQPILVSGTDGVGTKLMIAFEVDKHDIPDHTLLVGGFPCQDYSVARSLSNEKGIEGKKGVLWWEIAEVLEAKQPPFVLLENVDRLFMLFLEV